MRTGMTAPVWLGSILAIAAAAITLIRGCWHSSWVSDRRAGMAFIAAAPRSPKADAALSLTRGSGLLRSEIKSSIIKGIYWSAHRNDGVSRYRRHRYEPSGALG